MKSLWANNFPAVLQFCHYSTNILYNAEGPVLSHILISYFNYNLTQDDSLVKWCDSLTGNHRTKYLYIVTWRGGGGGRGVPELSLSV